MCLCVPYPCMSHVCTCSCVEKCWRARVFISSPQSWHQLTTFPAYWTTHYRHNNIVHALCVNKLNWCWLDFLPARTTVCQSVSLSVCQSVSLSVCQSVSLSVCGTHPGFISTEHSAHRCTISERIAPHYPLHTSLWWVKWPESTCQGDKGR